MLLSLVAAVRAEGEGQADLDAATEAKLNADKLADLGQVIDLCESALKKGLDDDNTTYAKQLLTSTLLERAAQYCRPIFEQKPPDARWPKFRDLAIQDLQKVLDYDKTVGSAYVLMARLQLLPGGDRAQARTAADKAVELLADDPGERAKALVLRGSLAEDVEQRGADLDAAVEADPESIDARRVRGIHHITQQRFDEAIADLMQVIEANPNDMAALQAVAEAFTSLKKFDEAAAQLDRIIALQPQSAAGYLLRARLNQLREDTEAALADLNKVLDIDTGNVFARIMRARIYMSQRKIEQAKADVDRVLEQNSQLAEAILLRSLILASEGNYAAAITDLKQIARAAPDNVAVRLQLAGFYLADERPRKAIELYDEILAADAEDFDALRGRGDARLAIGEHAQAIADYNAALKIDADDPGLLNNFAWTLATSTVDELRDAKRAVELATKACETTEYKLPHILSTLAAAYAEAGDFENARKWSSKACEMAEGEMKEQLQEELKSYEAEKPWREMKQTEEKDEPEPPSEEDLFID